MYDVIVLGATFAAAGIARIYKENCLILERSMRAGSEFFGALQFGSGYDKVPERKEAAALREHFLSSNIYSCDARIYPYLQQAHTLFGIQLVSTRKTENGFLCITHGVEGFCTYQAKRVIDTRSNAEISISKTFNLLIESNEKPGFADIHSEKAGMENHYVLRLSVPLSWGYAEARAAAQKVVRQFSETQRLILSADEFDYQVKAGYPKTEGGILYLPSKAYENPVLAFEAGLCIGEEMRK